MLDLLIRDGTIIDGSGNPGYKGCIAIKDGKIARIQRLPMSAQREIDATGLIVAPGFVDVHSHSDMVFFRDPRPDTQIRQGVTTEVDGNCGMSSAPLTGAEHLARMATYYWINETVQAFGPYETFGEYLDKVQKYGVCNHHAILVGHAPLRSAAMGWAPRPATQDEIKEMTRLLAESLDEGAAGLSIGLLYPPMTCATTEELTELCRVVAARGKIFGCHIRDYGINLIDSVQEMLKIAEASGVALHFSHLIITGKANWGKANQVLSMIDAARDRGLDIEVDLAEIQPKDVDRLKATGKFQILESMEQGANPYVVMNVSKPPFDDVRIRKAVNLALDRQAMIKVIALGQAVEQRGPLSPSVLGYWADVEKIGYGYDLNQAKSLMKEAGYIAGSSGILEKDGKPLKLTLRTRSTEPHSKVAQIVKEQLGALGVDLDIQMGELPLVRADILNGKYDIAVHSMNFFEADLLWVIFSSAQMGTGNQAQVKDPKLDQLLTASRTTLDPVQRQQVLNDAQKYIVEQAYAAPLYAGKIFYAVSNRVKGVSMMTNLAPLPYLMNAYLAGK